MTITPPASASAESTVAVAVAGEAGGGALPSIYVYAFPGASGCPEDGLELSYPPYSTDPHALAEVRPRVGPGPFSGTADLEIKQPGPYLLCGYFGSVVASAELTVGASAVEVERATEAKAREAAEQAPVSLLRVEIVADPGEYATNPGHTKIAVTTNSDAHVTIKLNHYGATFRYRAPGNGGVDIAWSCRHPGLTYHYVVTAIGGSGASISRSGRFRVPLTASMCRADARRSEERRRQEAHEAEEQKRKEESPRAKTEEHEREYCRQVLGGDPAGITIIAGHVYLDCHIYKTETHGSETIVVSESTIRG
jgi:hypothetical protein